VHVRTLAYLHFESISAMPATRLPLCDQTFALRLQTPSRDGAAPAGELEHVLSGECRTFDSGAGLLLALHALQAQRLPVIPDRSLAAQR